MNKQQINETLKNVKEMGERLNSLMDQQSKVINQLPPEERAKLSFINSEMEIIKKGIKEGDMTALETMLKKYANSDTK
jgi:uncharacterized coiled-coil DUF342 family protein